MRTVARIVPAVEPERLLGEREGVVPQRAPRGGARASAGRGTGPSRASRSRRALWKKNSPKSSKRAGTGSPSTSDVALDQVPAARAHEQGRGRPRRGGTRGRRARRTRSCRRSASIEVGLAADHGCVHVGELASSKSAMKPRAPEFSALMTILRSVGPVISTRRSASAGGAGATRQSPSRVGRLGQEVERAARRRARPGARSRAASSSRRRSSNPHGASATKRAAPRG